MKKSTLYILIAILLIALVYTNLPRGESPPSAPPVTPVSESPSDIPDISQTPADEPESVEYDSHYGQEVLIDETGTYSSKEDVARYLYTYGKLPNNYYTKSEARDLGWVAEEGNLWEVTDQGSIGGDRFQNREKLLPEASGRTWYECDIDYQGGSRNAKRIVFSSDGLIYYTDDHYESFEEIKQEDL